MSLADLMKKGSLRAAATATPATLATDNPQPTQSVAAVATVAVASAVDEAANEPTPDPDRWCWPASAAMNGAEIDTFTARVVRFTDKGVSLVDAERLSDKLAMRDREDDDRRLCLECVHLRCAGRWRCGNWVQSGVAIRPQDTQLPGELVLRLQRCDGFS